MRLKDCFKEDFNTWLVKSNNINIKPYISHKSKLDKIVEDSLGEILEVLLREPLADYFWYGYPEHGGRLTYSLPSSDVQTVPGDSLRVDGEKIKIFLRDYKITELLEIQSLLDGYKTTPTIEGI
jgi:hypothetical protein